MLMDSSSANQNFPAYLEIDLMRSCSEAFRNSFLNNWQETEILIGLTGKQYECTSSQRKTSNKEFLFTWNEYGGGLGKRSAI